jgi:hypothetical protein
VLSWLLQRRLMARLRDELGVSYGVSVDLDRVSAQEVYQLLWADCLPENAASAQAAATNVLWELTRRPLTAAELDEFRDGLASAPPSPARTMGALHNTACSMLVGLSPKTEAAWKREIAAVTPDSVTATWAAVAPSLLLAVPDAAEVPPELAKPLPIWSEHRLSGREVAGKKTKDGPGPGKMTVADTGLTLVTPSGDAVTVEYANVAAALYVGGRIDLIGHDGFALTFRPHDWTNPTAIAASIDRAVPPALRLQLQAAEGEPGTETDAARTVRPIVTAAVCLAMSWIPFAGLVIVAAILFEGRHQLRELPKVTKAILAAAVAVSLVATVALTPLMFRSDKRQGAAVASDR